MTMMVLRMNRSFLLSPVILLLHLAVVSNALSSVRQQQHMSAPLPMPVMTSSWQQQQQQTAATANANGANTYSSSNSNSNSNRPLHLCLFQLEENEGSNSQITQIILNSDSTVDIGTTDGPVPCTSKGTWMVRTANENNNDKKQEQQYYGGELEKRQEEKQGSRQVFFAMQIERSYSASGSRSSSNLGDFVYTVERDFVGEMTQVGNCLALSGSVHAVLGGSGGGDSSDGNDNDDAELFPSLQGLDAKVGYFSMLDVTDMLYQSNDDSNHGDNNDQQGNHQMSMRSYSF